MAKTRVQSEDMQSVKRPEANAEDPSTREAILETLRHWVSHHPKPDQPALSLGKHGEYSPRQLSEAVEKQSDAGVLFQQMIVYGARLYNGNIESVLESFRNETNTVPAGRPEASPKVAALRGERERFFRRREAPIAAAQADEREYEAPKAGTPADEGEFEAPEALTPADEGEFEAQLEDQRHWRSREAAAAPAFEKGGKF